LLISFCFCEKLRLRLVTSHICLPYPMEQNPEREEGISFSKHLLK
jgi:hypothetical protein